MRDLRRRAALVAILVAMGVVVPAVADEPTLQVHLDPERVGVEDVARLTVTIQGGAVKQEPQLGELSNLALAGGPFTQRNFSWVNGVASSATSFTWVLQPLAVGPASVGPVTVEVDGHSLTSGPISLEVAQGSLAPPRRPRPAPMNPLEQMLGLGGAQREARVSLSTLVGRREVVEGEPLVVTVVLDTTADIDGFEWTQPPTYPGFWTQRVDLPDRPSGQMVERDGVQYRRFPVARFVLIPLKPGSLTLPAASARVALRSFGMFAPPRVVERSAAPTTVTVTPRPPAPAGFAGAVGDLRYKASLEPTSARLGESLVLTVKLEGSGNLPLVEAPPSWPSAAGCETYPPEEDSTVKAGAEGLKGSRVWRVTVLPRHVGTLRFAPVELAVFDPATAKYRSQRLGPLVAEVTPPPPTPTPVGATPAPVATATPLPVITETRSAATPAHPPREPQRGQWWWVVVALLGGGMGGGLVVWWLLGRRGNGIPRARRGQAPADRARELQGVLEAWWLGVAESDRDDDLRGAMDELRRDLEAVRFAPTRADHSDTVRTIEARLKALMRRA